MPSPTINKIAYDFCNLVLDLDGNGTPFGTVAGITDVSYGTGVEREYQGGVDRFPTEMTDGVGTPTLSLTMFQYQYDAIYAHLAETGEAGPFGSEMSLSISFAKRGESVTRIDIPRFLLKSDSTQASRGPEAIKVQVECDVLGVVYRNGIGPFGERLTDDI
jgi:hypothetical protein